MKVLIVKVACEKGSGKEISGSSSGCRRKGNDLRSLDGEMKGIWLRRSFSLLCHCSRYHVLNLPHDGSVL